MRPSLKTIRRRAALTMGINRRNLQLVRPLNRRRFFPLADNKVLAKAFLAANNIPIAKTLKIYDAFYQLRYLAAEMREYTSFVFKPAGGRGGQGILVIKDRRDEAYISVSDKRVSADSLRRHAAGILFGAYSFGTDDRVLVEERLVADPELFALSPYGLPDLRIMLVNGQPILAMLRVATTASRGKANLHQGGIGLGIDLDSGRTTSAISKKGAVTHHPDTQMALRGVPIPCWDRALEISQQIGAVCPLRFLGVDVTIDRSRGPIVLEFNARPGLEIQNANRRGIRAVLSELE